MTSPGDSSGGRRRGTSDIEPAEDEELACQSDVRFADTTGTPDSVELAATAENYALVSEAPIVRDVTEDEKQFVGDLTEIGSPITNSENLSSAAVPAAAAADAATPTASRRNFVTAATTTTTSNSSTPPQQQQQLQQSTSTLSTTTATSNSSTPPQQQQQLQQSTSTLSTTTSSSSTSQLLAVGGPIPIPIPIPIPKRRPLTTEEDVGRTKAVHKGARRGLQRVSSSEWPADLDREKDGEDNQVAAAVASSNSEAPGAADEALRTRFEATFDRTERLSGRLLQRFEVTYEKRVRETRKQAAKPDNDGGNYPQESSSSSLQDPDDIFDDEPLFRMDKSSSTKLNSPLERPQPVEGAAKEDAALFCQLLQRLDSIMFATDKKIKRPNVQTATHLISKEPDKQGKRDSEKLKSSTSFNSQTSEDNGPDAQTVVAAAALADAAAAARSALEKWRGGIDDGTSSELSSREGTLSASRDDHRRNTAKASSVNREAPAADDGQISHDLTDPGSLHQVYSGYLGQDSSEKVKGQIGAHYLRQYYGPAEGQVEKDDLELSELKRRSRMKQSRLSRGLGYCGYLLPLLFVLVIFSSICYFSFRILLIKNMDNNYSLILFSLTTAAGGMFYCYNIFASEKHAI